MHNHILPNKNFLILLLFLILIILLFAGCWEYPYPPIIPTPPILPNYLTEIIVQPDTVDLEEGESQSIISITAYYSDARTANISLTNCTYSSNNPFCATVNSNGLISGVSTSSTNIVVVYNEGSVSKSDTITVIVITPLISANLTSIEIFPSTMSLSVGESQTISSVTAYYDDASSASISLNSCTYNSNNINYATIDDNGTISGVSEGTATITVFYTENEITKTDTVEITVDPTTQNEIVYRALCIGVGDYIYYDSEDDLLAPSFDVDRVYQTLGYCKFGLSNIEFYTISYLKDWQATKSNILQGIASTFSGADSDDVSYFYFSGHGSRLDNTSYLCPADMTLFVDSAISVDELESALSTIPGTKVVFIDACHSGGFIGKGTKEIKISKEELESFNDEVINVFSQIESKELLTINEYKVLTSCHYHQECMELSPVTPGDFDPFGVFTMALCAGCGYFGSYPADTNLDTKVSLQEAYLYVKSYVVELDAQLPSISITQDVQVYPDNSSFTIVEY